ncbi:hypothetical protein MNB_SV-14-607 [hydrothermal vent metagenome]|uniref:Uncharacterized protein n=1 Tax=hydrothermal vent metagenome TaxID=652676 RepID=A0A1W1CF90_9ZZZZ
MRRIVLIGLLFGLVEASEFEYGNGTFTMRGGFLGLDESIDTDVSTFSLVERHSNLFSSDFFYSYDLTWYDSKTLKQAQHTYNNSSSQFNTMLGLNNNENMKIPAIEHLVQGLDANVKFGYDILHKDKDNYFGIGLLVGVSIPWIDSSKDNNNQDDLGYKDYFKDTKTKINTYKIGSSINFQKSLISDKLSIYGIGSFAYQTGSIDNDYMDSELTVNGTFQEYNIGLYYTPFTQTYQWGWLKLSPRIYGTVGYKYSKWDVDDVAIDMSGAKLSSNTLNPMETKFSMETSVAYAGVGYSF